MAAIMRLQSGFYHKVMKTPSISFGPSPTKLEYYAPSGAKQSLTACQDGKLEPELSQGLKDGFVSSIADPRLHGPKADAGALGPGWGYTYTGEQCLRLGFSEGPHQEIRTQETAAGRQIEITTYNNGVEHHLSGLSKNGQVLQVSERAILDVSSAGTNVYCEGKVLFEMPSAFSGGCTW